jgi:hypothetical protein
LLPCNYNKVILNYQIITLNAACKKLGLGENPLFITAESMIRAMENHSQLFFRRLGGSGGMDA